MKANYECNALMRKDFQEFIPQEMAQEILRMSKEEIQNAVYEGHLDCLATAPDLTFTWCQLELALAKFAGLKTVPAQGRIAEALWPQDPEKSNPVSKRRCRKTPLVETEPNPEITNPERN